MFNTYSPRIAVRRHRLWLLPLVLVIWASLSQADAPFIDPAEDAEHFGPIDNILFWTTEQKVAGFRNIERLYWTRPVVAGDVPYALPYARRKLDDLRFEHDGADWTMQDYVRRMNIAGLLVIKDGNIVYERYELGNTEDSRWVSFSVAKSVTSMLVGAAIQDGYIGSFDDKVSDYLPRLKDSSYDEVTIKNLMQMSSGVQWNEDYADPEADINTIDWHTLSVYDYLRKLPLQSEPGKVFSYNTAETNLVGTLLRAAIGNNLSTYLTAKIWQPFGMEHDANWQLSEPAGGEFGGSSINATLRDYGRIGLFALHNGRLPDGTQVLPENWMAESTTPSRGLDRYGYLWWLRGEGAYAASGIFGQAIHIDPRHNLVIAQHAARDVASLPSDWAVQLAFFHAIAATLSQ